MSPVDTSSTTASPSDGDEKTDTATDDAIESGDEAANQNYRTGEVLTASKRLKQMISQHVETQEKRILELEDIIRKKELTERDTAQRLWELESTVANLETQNYLLRSDNESMKNFLQAKDDTVHRLQEKPKEILEKALKTISKLNDDVIAFMDENMALRRKYSTLVSGLECCQDALQHTMASTLETDVGLAFSTASPSSFGPSKKKAKSSDMAKENTLLPSPSLQLSPSTLRSSL